MKSGLVQFQRVEAEVLGAEARGTAGSVEEAFGGLSNADVVESLSDAALSSCFSGKEGLWRDRAQRARSRL